jgi:hypothetical protein
MDLNWSDDGYHKLSVTFAYYLLAEQFSTSTWYGVGGCLVSMLLLLALGGLNGGTNGIVNQAEGAFY